MANYKYNIIFNSAEQSRRNSTDDTRLATAFADRLCTEMIHHGFKGYNPDKHARLGSSMLKEHSRIVRETDFTVIIVTPEFFSDYWSDYKNESAFNFLTREGERHRLIPIGVHTTNLQELDVNTPLFFPDGISWQDEEKWRRLVQKFNGNLHDAPLTQPVQDVGDNILRTDGQNIVTRPVSAASSLASIDESILGTSVEGQCIPGANNEALNPVVVSAVEQHIPEPPVVSMERLNLDGEAMYNTESRFGESSAGVSMDGPRSESIPFSGAMDLSQRSEGTNQTGPKAANQNDGATGNADLLLTDSNVHRALPGEEMSRILDDAPVLSLCSIQDNTLSETPPQMANGRENAQTSNVAPELLEGRGNSKNDKDQLNDDDLDVDVPLLLDVSQSPTLPTISMERDAETTKMPPNKSSTTGIIRNPKHISNTQCSADISVTSADGELSDTYGDTPESKQKKTSDKYGNTPEGKPEGSEGFNAMNIVRAGVNTVVNVFRWFYDSDRAFN